MRQQTIVAAHREWGVVGGLGGGGRGEDLHIAVWEVRREKRRDRGGEKKKEKADEWREKGYRQILQFGETKGWRGEGKGRGRNEVEIGNRRGEALESGSARACTRWRRSEKIRHNAFN